MLLAIETSCARGSVAIIDASGEIESAELPGERDHGRALALTVQRLVNGREDKLMAYGLSIGPGSFTGLRIGLAFLKGFGLVYPLPTLAISTLQIMASASAEADEAQALPVLALLDARAGAVYAGLYEHDEAGALRPDSRLPDGLYRREELITQLGETNLRATGDGLDISPRFENIGEIPGAWLRSPPTIWNPKASVLAGLAWSAFEKGEGVALLDLEPKYHQLSAAEQKN